MKSLFGSIMCLSFFCSHLAHAQEQPEMRGRVIYLANKTSLDLENQDTVKSLKIKGVASESEGPVLYFSSCYSWDVEADHGLNCISLISNGITIRDTGNMMTRLGLEEFYRLTGEVFDVVEDLESVADGHVKTIETDSDIDELSLNLSQALDVLDGDGDGNGN